MSVTFTAVLPTNIGLDQTPVEYKITATSRESGSEVTNTFTVTYQHVCRSSELTPSTPVGETDMQTTRLGPEKFFTFADFTDSVGQCGEINYVIYEKVDGDDIIYDNTWLILNEDVTPNQVKLDSNSLDDPLINYNQEMLVRGFLVDWYDFTPGSGQTADIQFFITIAACDVTEVKWTEDFADLEYTVKNDALVTTIPVPDHVPECAFGNTYTIYDNTNGEKNLLLSDSGQPISITSTLTELTVTVDTDECVAKDVPIVIDAESDGVTGTIDFIVKIKIDCRCNELALPTDNVAAFDDVLMIFDQDVKRFTTTFTETFPELGCTTFTLTTDPDNISVISKDESQKPAITTVIDAIVPANANLDGQSVVVTVTAVNVQDASNDVR